MQGCCRLDQTEYSFGNSGSLSGECLVLPSLLSHYEGKVAGDRRTQGEIKTANVCASNLSSFSVCLHAWSLGMRIYVPPTNA